jgi:hypothetical protein
MEYMDSCFVKISKSQDEIDLLCENIVESLDYLNNVLEQSKRKITSVNDELLLYLTNKLKDLEKSLYQLKLENNNLTIQIKDNINGLRNSHIHTENLVNLNRNCMSMLQFSVVGSILSGIICIIFIWGIVKQPNNKNILINKLRSRKSAIFHHTVLDDVLLLTEQYKYLLLSTKLGEENTFELNSEQITKENVNRFSKKIEKKIEKAKNNLISELIPVFIKNIPLLEPEYSYNFETWYNFINLADKLGSSYFMLEILNKKNIIKRIDIFSEAYYLEEEDKMLSDTISMVEEDEKDSFILFDILVGN